MASGLSLSKICEARTGLCPLHRPLHSLPYRAMSSSPTDFLVLLIDDLRVWALGCTGSTFYEAPNLGDIRHDFLRFHLG